MKNCTLLIKIFLSLSIWVLLSCGIDTWEVTDTGYTWTYQGLIDDTTAVAKVEQWESGTIHCNHFMGWDDDFSSTLSTNYYAISLKQNKIGKKKSALKDFIPQKDSVFVGLPYWTESCLAKDTIDNKFYCINSSKLDEFSTACTLILVDADKKDLDSLEFEHCDFDLHKDISFEAHYLKVSGDLYAIQKGKLKSQKPTYTIIDKNSPLIIINSQGDSIFYEGKP